MASLNVQPRRPTIISLETSCSGTRSVVQREIHDAREHGQRKNVLNELRGSAHCDTTKLIGEAREERLVIKWFIPEINSEPISKPLGGRSRAGRL